MLWSFVYNIPDSGVSEYSSSNNSTLALVKIRSYENLDQYFFIPYSSASE